MTQSQTCYEVDQLIRLLEQPMQDEGNVILAKIQESLRFMREHRQFKLMYVCLRRLRRESDAAVFTDEVLRQYLICAIESDIEPKEGQDVAQEVYQSLKHPLSILTASQITRYVCHQAQVDQLSLTRLLFEVAKHDLSYERDLLLKNNLLSELSLLKTLEPSN